MPSDGKRDLGGMVVSALFILVGAAVMWDATNMVDADSFVFPVTVAIVMMWFSLFYIVANLLRTPADSSGKAKQPGSTPRRVGLVAAMLGAALMMPYTGFVISGLAVFAVIMILAMYERWTSRRLLVYPLVCIAVVTGFYFLFAKALMVPLPEAPFL